MDEGSKGIVLNLTVDDRDDPATGAWRAIYSIINGDPNHNFAIHTNPDNNEGMLSVVKVHYPCCYYPAEPIIQKYIYLNFYDVLFWLQEFIKKIQRVSFAWKKRREKVFFSKKKNFCQ